MELTKSSWSFQTLARFIFIVKENLSGNTGLVLDSQETFKNIFISRYRDQLMLSLSNAFLEIRHKSFDLSLHRYLGLLEISRMEPQNED